MKKMLTIVALIVALFGFFGTNAEAATFEGIGCYRPEMEEYFLSPVSRVEDVQTFMKNREPGEYVVLIPNGSKGRHIYISFISVCRQHCYENHGFKEASKHVPVDVVKEVAEALHTDALIPLYFVVK